MYFSLFMVVLWSLNTTGECAIADVYCAIWDCNRSEVVAECEGTSIDVCHTIWNCNRSETKAAEEGFFSDACHTIWNYNRSETIALTESLISNTRHRIRDGDGGETIATIVFVSYYCSILYVLNDRKVIA